MSENTILIPPFFLEVDGVKVEVLEALKHSLISGEVFYTIALRIHYKDIISRIFRLTVRNVDELRDKIKVEVTKIKFMEYAYGIKYVRSVIT